MRGIVHRTALRRAVRWAILVLLVLGSLLGLPTTAFARGGGGGHSGGGGGGRSGGGGLGGGAGGGGSGIGGGGGGGIGGGGVVSGGGGVAHYGYDLIGILVLVVIAALILGLLFIVVRRHPVVHDDFQPVPAQSGPDPA